MKFKQTLTVIVQEFIGNGIGWIAGLVAADLLSHFFVAKKWWNLGGRLSKKAALDANTLGVVEWIATAVIGFIVLLIVNKYISPWLLRKFKKRDKVDS